MAVDEARLTPDEIDESFVARRIDAAAQVAINEELVLVRMDGAQATVLNETGSLLWECFDGTTTIGELVDELSEELGIDHDTVRADVLAFARLLGDAGLLEGVGTPPIELNLDDFEWEPPHTMEVGDELDDFTLADLDGADHSLSDYRGREVLLVNWSPTCRFCTTIADRLAAWQPSLEEAGVELVFLTRGDVDANRAVFDAAGMQATALVLDDGLDPFPGTGTPAAYHLDADGRLAAPMAIGAFDVPILAATLAGVDPDAAVDAVAPDAVLDDESSDPVPEGTLYLPVAGGMCGPGGGAAGSANSTDWAGTRAYRVGDYHVGVGYNTEATADTLDALFDGARVRDRRAQASYSVALHDSDGASRQLDLLVQGSQQLVRSRSAARVLRALLWRLSADVVGFDTKSGRLRVNATAAVRGGDGLLLPPGLNQWTKQLQPRFGRLGVALADVPYPEIDVHTAELVIPEPAIPYNAEVLASVDEGVRLGTEPPAVVPGRYPLTAWCFPRTTEQAGALTPAVAAVAALPSVFDTDDVPERVEQLGALFTRTRAVGIAYGSEAELVDAVAAALA